MKKYILSGAASFEHKPEHPERTAKRQMGGKSSMNFDIQYQVWPSREAMLKTCDMQRRREHHFSDWVPIVKPNYW